MDEDDIEVLKESCLNDLFRDSSISKEQDCQIQISSVFSLASQDSGSAPPVDTNFNVHHLHLHSKQFDSEAILNNLPNNPSVSSTTTEASRDEAGTSKENEATSDSIKNDDGSVGLKTASDDAGPGEVSDPDSTRRTDVMEGEGTKSSSVKSAEEQRTGPTSSSSASDVVPLPEWDEVTSTTCDQAPPSPPPPPPPSPPSPVPLTPPPAPVFKTDLSQFFSKEPRLAVASQGGQNVIPVTAEGEGREDEEDNSSHSGRKVLVRIPREMKVPSAPLPLAVTPPSVEPLPPVKRKRGRPKGSKNKKKFVPTLSSLPTKCKRCAFLRKSRR